MNQILKQRFASFSTLEIQDLLDADDRCIETGHVSFQGIWSILKQKYTIKRKESFRILHEAFEDWFFTFTDHGEFNSNTKFWQGFDPRSISHSFCQEEFHKMNLPTGHE